MESRGGGWGCSLPPQRPLISKLLTPCLYVQPHWSVSLLNAKCFTCHPQVHVSSSCGLSAHKVTKTQNKIREFCISGLRIASALWSSDKDDLVQHNHPTSHIQILLSGNRGVVLFSCKCCTVAVPLKHLQTLIMGLNPENFKQLNEVFTLIN